MSSPAGGEVRVGIGARLRAGRERSGFTLLQAAEKMHVDSKVLEALEAEQFDALGAPVFARGHLRRYAELIGEHGAQLQGMYAESTRMNPQPDLRRVPRMRRPSNSRKLVGPGVIALVAIAIGGGVWIVLQLGRSDTEQKFETTELVVPPAEAPAVATAPVVAAPKSATLPAAQSRAARTAAAGTKIAAAGSPPKPGAKPGAVAAAAPATAAVKPRTVAVKLKFAADSWVEVYDVNGDRLFYDIGAADSERSVTGTPPLRVVLGNATGVSLDVNGRERKVPPALVQGDGAQFTINRSGRIIK